MPFRNPHPLYTVWHSMKERCRNKNFRQWKNYGGRGIRVCDRWLGKDGFKNFVADMGDRPHGYSIDRINNDGNYEPQNCRWSSKKQQQHNQSVTRRVTIDGVEYIAVELAQAHGFKTDTIVKRASLGLSLKEAISPLRRVYTEGLALGGAANGRKQQAKTHCPKGHPYTEENIIKSKTNNRRCKTCHREKAAKNRASRR